MRRIAIVSLLIAGVACTSSPRSDDGGTQGDAFRSPSPLPAAKGFSLSSTVWKNGGTIPVKYTCDGAEATPSLAWRKPPSGTKAYAVTLDDPDAPGGTFIHWVLWNIPAKSSELAQGEIPDGAHQARNSADKTGYTGPCPPKGSTHHYTITLYALQKQLGVSEGADAKQAENAIRAAAIGHASMTLTYSR